MTARSRGPSVSAARFSLTPDFFKNLVDNMQVGVIVADREGYLIYINETYGRFLNIDPQANLGKHATEVVANTRLHVVAKTGKAEVNYPHQFKDTGYLVHRIPIREKGEVIAVLGLVLFDSASTVSKLAAKLSILESKVDLYENELLSLRSTRYTIEGIVGESQPLMNLKQQALKAAKTTLPVLITGESGTGKEMFAQGIHHASGRRLRPFVRINCSTIPKELIESELFGYEEGAFTGARSKGKPGKFELAHQGTVLLDEIGDLPLEMQPKLLRVLEEKEFERVGGTALRTADFRLLAATNRNLDQMLAENRFRQDLYYRLNVITLHIPPLRERREDILLLARHLLRQITQDSAMPPLNIDPQAEERLLNYAWPGNVRELNNVLERAVSYLDGDTIRPRDLPVRLSRRLQGTRAANLASLRKDHGEAERETICRALDSAGYNKKRAAEILGIHRSLLYKKAQEVRHSPDPAGRGGSRRLASRIQHSAFRIAIPRTP